MELVVISRTEQNGYNRYNHVRDDWLSARHVMDIYCAAVDGYWPFLTHGMWLSSIEFSGNYGLFVVLTFGPSIFGGVSYTNCILIISNYVAVPLLKLSLFV